MQMAAEQAAGARALTQITSYSNHALEQFAGGDGGIGVTQSAFSGAWSDPQKLNMSFQAWEDLDSDRQRALQ
ncbi:hypothetical protein PSE10C_46980 [Pseudomonas amygdali pv. eriobotryae]|uniref:Uncharacterized protein n=1 Tax=Pseudomonas amygdali pv. eriobotryae TaxID=129137 RepID=A0A9P3EEK6_PSEA0|nr:hypothetical protein AL052_25675 [Pseudomonas amygdali pv. eriobotryae]GFZ61657.1 hypothetical protein PSE10A_41680 [Pseudomonas amygdali pv. eriobotryae]GFZ73956.1 hypothetical protein PSE10C_46980 [Pseudomonas amygdali pv. eriobotryae]